MIIYILQVLAVFLCIMTGKAVVLTRLQALIHNRNYVVSVYDWLFSACVTLLYFYPPVFN